MNHYPKVSVVTITYGHENHIEQTLDGVLMQNYNGQIEFIIANDNSPDDTDDIIRRYFSTKNIPSNFTVKYTKHEHNKGMLPNFIWSLKQVSGEYIALCEGDDYWNDSHKLQKQVDFLEQYKDYGLIHTNYKEFYPEKSLFKIHIPQKEFNRDDENAFYLKTGDIRTCTVLFRAQFLPEIMEITSQDFMQNAVVGDRPLFLLISKISKLYYLNEVTSVYYISNSTSASHFSDVFKYYEYLKKVAQLNYTTLKYLEFDQNINSKYEDRLRYLNMFALINDNKLKFYKEFLFHFFAMKLNTLQIREIVGVYRKTQGIR